MDIVVDTSVIVAVVLNEPPKMQLIEKTSDTTLYAPASLHWEIGNAFSAILKRKRMTLKEIEKAIQAYHQIPLRHVEITLEDAIRLANRLNIYAYDAYVIVCALTHNAPLLTLDRGLVHAAQLAGVTVIEVEL